MTATTTAIATTAAQGHKSLICGEQGVLRVHGRGNCSLVEVILTAVLVALLLRVDKVDLDEKDGGIYQAKERNECLSFVKLRIFDEIGIPCDHCINLQLRHAEERSKEVRPESRLADTLS